MNIPERLKDKISLLPDSPGVYMYYDKEGNIIYIGKAKKLHRRVMSYFNRVHPIVRTNILVRNIYDLKYIVVSTEEDALHLENSLIKEHKPRYNVLLKDDKSYPWICVTNELYPRIFLTRQLMKNGARYYGPYSNVQVARTVLSLIRDIYPIRTCAYAITKDIIDRKKLKVCLQYHIKNCLGCCIGEISPEKYGGFISGIKQILSGNTQHLCDLLLDEMEQLSSEMKFEEAQAVKEKYQLVEKYKAKSVIVSAQITDVNVFSFVRDEDSAFINYMHVKNGSIVQSLTYEYKSRLGENDGELLSYAIAEIHDRFGNKTKEAIVPFMPDAEFSNVQFIIPQKGDKKKLLDVSTQNARQYMVDKLKQSEKLNPDQRLMRTLSTIQKDFRLQELPVHIECFDNSNIQGTNPVASCVVFKNAKPSKRDYRHFNIKTVEGPDDFASMSEVIFRRYKRLIDEEQELPQLIVVDGGKGQLSAALSSLEALGLRGRIAIVGIAKRLEEIYFPGDSIPLYIDKNSESLKVIQNMRDEAHRFGITHHRNRRSKGQVHSILDDIPGIGEKTRETLLKHFKSLKRIKAASLDDISAVVGKAKAQVIVNQLNKQN